MSTTIDGAQLSPCVKVFIELLIDEASTVASSNVAAVRQPEEVATHFRAGVPPLALISKGGR
jgi:hypothetical protein